MVRRFRSIEFSTTELGLDRLLFITVKSENLRGRGDITVYIPECGKHFGESLPMVTLLHGVYGSHWAWAFQGRAHDTAARLIAAGSLSPMMIVMPSDGLWGDGSGYFAHSGYDFEAWIMEDLLGALIEVGAPVSTASRQFIGGLSMGGFGALRIAARHSGRFAAASGLSSLTHFDQFHLFVEESLSEYGLSKEDQSLVDLLVQHKAHLPPIRFDCGVDDPLIEHNRNMHRELLLENVSHEYAEHPGGHTWDYWSQHLAETYIFFDRVFRES